MRPHISPPSRAAKPDPNWPSPPSLRSASPPVTLEFQREQAKALTKFFKQQQVNALINDSTCALSLTVRLLF